MRYACYLHALHYVKCPVTSIVWSLHSKCIQLRPTIKHIKNVMICKICNHNLNCIGILFQNWHVFRVCLRKDEGINHQLHLFQEKVSQEVTSCNFEGGHYSQFMADSWNIESFYSPTKEVWELTNGTLETNLYPPNPPTQPPQPPPSPPQTSFPEILSQRGVGEWGVKITIHTYM